VAKELSEELNKREWGIFIMIHSSIVSVGSAKLKKRCRDTERHNLFACVRNKRILILYYDTKFEWVREAYTGSSTKESEK
jgi:hypothetical protein